MAGGLGRIFECGPVFRAEKSHSRKHTTDKYTAHQNATIMHNWKKQITEYGNTGYKKENNSVTNQ